MLWLGTSWKMNKTLSEATEWVQAVLAGLRRRGWDEEPPVHPFVVPSFTATSTVHSLLGSASPVLLGVQNAHWEDSGAWTGEVSVPQAADAGARLVEIGHSERRAAFGETVETTRLKVAATLRHGLVPLLCVGEPEGERARSVDFVLAQAEGALEGLDADARSRVVLAYEPVWAIGVGGREARPEEVGAPIAALGGLGARAVLFGGSVNARNAAGLLTVPGVEGLFVGRAAWVPEGFLTLLDAVAAASR